MSLFEVAFAEASHVDGAPLVTASEPVSLSPLRPRYCLSTHPRERPALKPGCKAHHAYGELRMLDDYAECLRRLSGLYPGLAALAKFFDVAAGRRAVPRPGRLPLELYDLILGHVDRDTWRACAAVSRDLRALCLCRFRLDDSISVVAGPVVPRVMPKDSPNAKDAVV